MKRLPDAVAVGYFLKTRTPRPDGWNGPKHVSEIASVSECIAKGPEGWLELWEHNALGLFPTEDVARRLTRGSREFSLVAYKVFPLLFVEGSAQAWTPPVVEILEASGYDLLGYDVVSRSGDSLFECSPLSCNLAANEYPVNAYCLSDTLEHAYDASLRISAGNYEPGPYHLVEVHRKITGAESSQPRL